MRVLITVAAWGDKNVDLFLNYSLASLLADGNLPKLTRRHDVTFHIQTPAAEREAMLAHEMVRRLAAICRIEWDIIASKRLPDTQSGAKYEVLSGLQNRAIKASVKYDALIINYADFVWADGSLVGAVGYLTEGVDSVMTFCLPLDERKACADLNVARADDCAICLPPRALAKVGLACLHREATYRFWDAPIFTCVPSYLLFKVPDQGVIVRAFHQTALVLRVKPDDPNYLRGICSGTLDGNYSADIARRGGAIHANDSDRVLVFSLHDAAGNSARRGDRTAMLRDFIRRRASQQQRIFADAPLRVKVADSDALAWLAVEQSSAATLALAR